MSDITELFNRDPLDLSKQDIQEIIKFMREQRQRFAIEGVKAKAPAKKVDPKKPLNKVKEIDLGDLGL